MIIEKYRTTKNFNYYFFYVKLFIIIYYKLICFAKLFLFNMITQHIFVIILFINILLLLTILIVINKYYKI